MFPLLVCFRWSMLNSKRGIPRVRDVTFIYPQWWILDCGVSTIMYCGKMYVLRYASRVQSTNEVTPVALPCLRGPPDDHGEHQSPESKWRWPLSVQHSSLSLSRFSSTSTALYRIGVEVGSAKTAARLVRHSARSCWQSWRVNSARYGGGGGGGGGGGIARASLCWHVCLAAGTFF